MGQGGIAYSFRVGGVKAVVDSIKTGVDDIHNTDLPAVKQSSMGLKSMSIRHSGVLPAALVGGGSCIGGAMAAGVVTAASSHRSHRCRCDC